MGRNPSEVWSERQSQTNKTFYPPKGRGAHGRMPKGGMIRRASYLQRQRVWIRLAHPPEGRGAHWRMPRGERLYLIRPRGAVRVGTCPRGDRSHDFSEQVDL